MPLLRLCLSLLLFFLVSISSQQPDPPSTTIKPSTEKDYPLELGTPTIGGPPAFINGLCNWDSDWNKIKQLPCKNDPNQLCDNPYYYAATYEENPESPPLPNGYNDFSASNDICFRDPAKMYDEVHKHDFTYKQNALQCLLSTVIHPSYFCFNTLYRDSTDPSKPRTDYWAGGIMQLSQYRAQDDPSYFQKWPLDAECYGRPCDEYGYRGPLIDQTDPAHRWHFTGLSGYDEPWKPFPRLDSMNRIRYPILQVAPGCHHACNTETFGEGSTQLYYRKLLFVPHNQITRRINFLLCTHEPNTVDWMFWGDPATELYSAEPDPDYGEDLTGDPKGPRLFLHVDVFNHSQYAQMRSPRAGRGPFKIMRFVDLGCKKEHYGYREEEPHLFKRVTQNYDRRLDVPICQHGSEIKWWYRFMAYTECDMTPLVCRRDYEQRNWNGHDDLRQVDRFQMRNPKMKFRHYPKFGAQCFPLFRKSMVGLNVRTYAQRNDLKEEFLREDFKNKSFRDFPSPGRVYLNDAGFDYAFYPPRNLAPELGGKPEMDLCRQEHFDELGIDWKKLNPQERTLKVLTTVVLACRFVQCEPRGRIPNFVLEDPKLIPVCVPRFPDLLGYPVKLLNHPATYIQSESDFFQVNKYSGDFCEDLVIVGTYYNATREEVIMQKYFDGECELKPLCNTVEFGQKKSDYLQESREGYIDTSRFMVPVNSKTGHRWRYNYFRDFLMRNSTFDTKVRPSHLYRSWRYFVENMPWYDRKFNPDGYYGLPKLETVPLNICDRLCSMKTMFPPDGCIPRPGYGRDALYVGEEFAVPWCDKFITLLRSSEYAEQLARKLGCYPRMLCSKRGKCPVPNEPYANPPTHVRSDRVNYYQIYRLDCIPCKNNCTYADAEIFECSNETRASIIVDEDTTMEPDFNIFHREKLAPLIACALILFAICWITLCIMVYLVDLCVWRRRHRKILENRSVSSHRSTSDRHTLEQFLSQKMSNRRSKRNERSREDIQKASKKSREDIQKVSHGQTNKSREEIQKVRQTMKSREDSHEVPNRETKKSREDINEISKRNGEDSHKASRRQKKSREDVHPVRPTGSAAI